MALVRFGARSASTAEMAFGVARRSRAQLRRALAHSGSGSTEAV
jgi:hypothetical protein